MSFNVARWRPAPLAPRTTGWGLWLAIMLLTLIGAGASIVGVALAREAWERRTTWGESVTVAAMAHGLESADAAAARAEELLKRQPGVAAVDVREARPDDALIAGLMGAAAKGTETPRFLDVRPAPGARLAPADLAAPLAAQGILARLDDHRDSSAPVESTAMLIAAGELAVIVVALVLMGEIVVRAARLAVRRVTKRMSLMISLGATRPLLAAQFPQAITASSAVGAAIGALLAAALTLMAVAGPLKAQAASIGFDPADLLAAAPWPLAAILIGWIFARVGAAGALRRVR